MASVIKAGNATDGVQVTSDNTGILELKTGTGAGTTALTVDTSQNVGIGTSSPAYRLDVLQAGATTISSAFAMARITGGNATANDLTLIGPNTSQVRINFGDTDAGNIGEVGYNHANNSMRFVTNGSAQATIDSSGNVGIGSTPVNSRRLTINTSGQTDLSIVAASNNYAQLLFGYTGADNKGIIAYYNSDNSMQFYTNSTERARIDASGFTQFSSNLVMPYQGAPTSKAAAATLSGAELITGILNTTGTTYTITLPTGTNIEGALTWSANNVSLDWYVINTASGTITIGANGNTTLGSLTIATGTSAQFRIRRTAANTFTVYRL